MGRLLITLGLLLVGAGLLVQFGVPLGRLPGDIVIRRESGTFYLPIATCLLASVVLSILAALIRR